MDDTSLPPRDSMDVDVVIVGAGPAGLATAIRLKQLAAQSGDDLHVVVLEKGAEVGAHILSGAVIDPIGLDALIADWRDDDTCPLKTPVTSDQFKVLGSAGALTLPSFLMPKMLHNHGNYIGSLGQLCQWLAARAEALGVEIYPGFAACELLYDDAGERVVGVATQDMGLDRDGRPKDSFERGMALHARAVVLAEGVRGSLTKQVIQRYGLDQDRSPQKYGIGLKELWRIPKHQHRPGLVQHSFGWPLDGKTGGGSFLYHYDEDLVSIGFVVHLDYKNPYLSPYDVFQTFKTHPDIRAVLEGGERLSYGARAISEGGYQSVPDCAFPGGVLVGCAAGFVNVPRIKGSHNALLSGVLAAEHLVQNLNAAGEASADFSSFSQAWKASPIGRDLYPARNVKPLWSRFGTVLGVALGGVDMWCQSLLRFSPFGTLTHKKADYACLEPAHQHAPISYPAPDGVFSFDKLSSVFLSGTNHEEDQPCHLKLADADVPVGVNLPQFAEPAQRYCPAGVYEVVEQDGAPRFVINAQNCVHCKTCDIKDPSQNITWDVPEGGGGPLYQGM